MTVTPGRAARLIVGVLTIALGIAAFAWPKATLQVVAVLFGLQLVGSGFAPSSFSSGRSSLLASSS